MLDSKNQYHASPTEMSRPPFSDNGVSSRRFARIKQHLYSDLNGEAVILSIKNGKYYGLNAVGASVWNALDHPSNFSDILAAVMGEYEVDESVCRHEVHSFLERMVAEGLVEVLDEKVA